MSQNTGLWGWLESFGGSCGFKAQPKLGPMWVKASPDLFPLEVPGMEAELLGKIRQPGGSLDEKMQEVSDAFRNSARHLESLQQVLRKRTLDRIGYMGDPDAMPERVQEVIKEGTYTESFLSAFDGKTFVVHSEEIVPGHEYQMALEVHTGGSYWSSIPLDNSSTVRHRVETVSASSQNEGSASIVAQYGAAQRGAVFVWRWLNLPERGPYDVPSWLSRGLSTEGNDPLRKLQGELEALKRWEQHVKQEAAKFIKEGAEIKNPYIREVLRLWPSEIDAQGCEQLKKCAWVEGLDPKLFTGKRVVVHRVQYDADHALALNATIAMRHQEDTMPKEGDPPYRLTTSWHWASPAAIAATQSSMAAQSASYSSHSRGAEDPEDSTVGRTQELSGLAALAAASQPEDCTVGHTQELAGLAATGQLQPA